MFIVNDPVTTEAYNADATDGGMNDAGITYSLGGINPGVFNINPDTGSVTYRTSPDRPGQPHSQHHRHRQRRQHRHHHGHRHRRVQRQRRPCESAGRAKPDVRRRAHHAHPDYPGNFDAATTAYTAEVGGGVTAVTVLAPPARTVLGVVAISGTAADGSALTAVIPTGIATDNTGTRRVSGLTEGANTITIEVTAPDSATIKTYTLTVNVASSPTFAGTIAAQTYTVGQPVSLSLPTATAALPR